MAVHRFEGDECNVGDVSNDLNGDGSYTEVMIMWRPEETN